MTQPDAVELWQRDPGRSVMAQLGTAMLNGEWVSRDDAKAAGVSTSVVGQAVKKLREAGYKVETKAAGAYGIKAHRVRPTRSAPAARRDKVHAEASGLTHPAVGSTVKVRAVVADDDGSLSMQLSDGNGKAWTVTVTGHVGH